MLRVHEDLPQVFTTFCMAPVARAARAMVAEVRLTLQKATPIVWELIPTASLGGPQRF